MPWLGYALDLPAGWERVEGDPEAPVPSFEQIEADDPPTAQDLQTVAQQLEGGGRLFDALGLWAVDPVSLMQVGLLAGTPYRVPAAALESGVRESVANRTSELSVPLIEPITVPAGEGYQAVYFDRDDLSEHREVHLRTPSGRYLILASTYPGVAEPELAATFDAIATSIRPLEGEGSGDRPEPSAGPEGRADPALQALLPTHVGEIELTSRSLNGESLVGGDMATGGTVAGELGVLVNAPGDVSMALAVPTDDTPLLIVAFRLAGADEQSIADFLAGLPPEIWSRTTIDGRDVLVSVPGTDGGRTWLLADEGADHGLLYQVESNDQALGEQAIRALP
jgi:hypothetical protein